MDFDETVGKPEVDARPDDPVAAELREVIVGSPEPGIETRQHKAMVAAALFDEPLTPVHIGRFTVVRKLGAGGMGVVYVAYDEPLDRRVAVKLLHSAETDTRGHARLEREAQAMARLSHPNVVTVHEVGTHRGQVFVAMEFVEGGDLRAWLSAERRDWKAIVDLFCQAGEGLAAAHQAGIVHRDFKPDNVLVGADGRVRVADFGLAHGHEPRLSSTDAGDPEAITSNNALERTLTKTGALVGTPAYMAPEQFAGKRVDARADQFAFCVALWEGVYGQRPFSGRNLVALSSAIAGGLLDEPPSDLDVPAWLRAALIRGLAPKPDDRWPSMRALLEVLGNDPHARRRRRLRIAALTGAAGIVASGLVYIAATQIQENSRRRYWSALTEQLLDIERTRGFRQATDDARRARDATRMSVARRHRPRGSVADHEDPTVAAVLLREVEGSARSSEAWISAANETLGQPISHAVLTGHRDVVTALAFAPDEHVLYSGSSDGEVRRWDLETGLGRTVIVHDDNKEVTGLALSPDGPTVVSAAKDGALRSWSAAAGPRILARGEAELTDVAFAPDGRSVVSASLDGTATIHELGAETRVALRGHTREVFAAQFDASGARVLTASADGTARLWSVDGEPLAILEGHTDEVFHARFVDRDLVVTGSDDHTVRLWRLGDDALIDGELLGRFDQEITALTVHGRTVAAAALDGSVGVASVDDPSSWRIIDEHTREVWSLAFTRDGAGLISASVDTTAKLHDLRDGGPSRTFTGHRLALLSADVDPSGRWLATGAWDGEVRVWDLARPSLATELLGHGDLIMTVGFDDPGARVLTASQDGKVRLWGADTGALLTTLDHGHAILFHAALSSDGRHVAAATRTGTIELWDLSTGRRRSLQGHTRTVWMVAFDDAGERLGSVSSDRTARIWNLAGEPLLVLEGHEARVSAIDLGGPDEPIATASHDGTLRLWDPDDGHARAVLRGHQGMIIALTRSPTGVLATTSDDGTARLWPDASERNAIALEGHRKTVWSVAFDETGERVVTTSLDGTARVWDTRDGGLLATLEGHAESVWEARFAGTDRIITVSDDHSIRIWSLIDDTPPIVLSGHANPVIHLAVSPDARRLVTASSDHVAKIWDLDQLSSDPDGLIAELYAATSYCLDVEQRVRELGEALHEAAAAFAACERR